MNKPPREEFPRPLPHPRFFGWATAIALAGLLVWNARLEGLWNPNFGFILLMIVLALGAAYARK